MIVYPETRYEFKSEVTYKPSAVLVQVFHHIAVLRDVPDPDAVFEEVEVPQEPMRLRQRDGSFIEIPRANAKPTIQRKKVKEGYEGVRIYSLDEPQVIDILRQVTWDFKIRRGLDAAHPFCPLIHWPDQNRIVMVMHGWTSGAEVGPPVNYKEMPYDKTLDAIKDVYEAADIRNAEGYVSLDEDSLSIEEMKRRIEEYDRKKAAGQADDGTFKL